MSFSVFDYGLEETAVWYKLNWFVASAVCFQGVGAGYLCAAFGGTAQVLAVVNRSLVGSTITHVGTGHRVTDA
eukprot:670803-Rhodomonas_salina.2